MKLVACNNDECPRIDCLRKKLHKNDIMDTKSFGYNVGDDYCGFYYPDPKGIVAADLKNIREEEK